MPLHVRINVPAIPSVLETLAEALVSVDVWMMEHAADNGVELPPLYESGIVYRREPPGREWWETASDLLSFVTNRSGDCEDVAAYRVAELRVFDGEHAILRVVPTRRGTLHAVVEREDGTIEDPSRILVTLERERLRRARKAA